MGTIKNTYNREALLRLIERYFEAETSLEEERYLRQLLVETDCDDPAVEAARAVMGVFAVDRKIADYKSQKTVLKPQRKLRGVRWAVISAVASVAIIVAVVSLMNSGQRTNQDMLSVAFVGDLHDFIAQQTSIENTLDAHHNTMAMAAMTINNPESPAEIDALIKSELGLMAEAQNSVYESVVNDFTAISSIIK